MSWSTPILIYSHPEPRSEDLEPIGAPDSPSDATVVRLGALTKLELDPDQAFRQLHNPEILVSFLPGSSLTRIVDARNFRARASIGVGPLHLGYDAEACITASDPGARTASMTVQARPRGLGMPFRARMAMAVNPMGGGSRIEMRFAVAISGSRVPHAWLDRITCDVLEGAVRELKEQLDASSALVHRARQLTHSKTRRGVKDMTRRLTLFAIAVAVALGFATPATLALAQHSSAPTATPPESARSGAGVVAWNSELLHIVKRPGAQPSTIHPTRSFAILHAAIYDAVVSVTHQDSPYLFSVAAPQGARADAAAAAAGHDVLAGLYPTFAAELDQMLAGQLAAIPHGKPKQAGLTVGREVAHQLLTDRADDGSGLVPPAFVTGTQPGDYRPTPPLFPAPVFSNWGSVRPFVLDSGSQFRPQPMPAVTSAAYAKALNETKSLGQNTSITRTPDQSVAAKFWAPPIWNTWNEIAERAATKHRTDLETTARLFAVLNLAFADSAIAFYDAKYHYLVWRPVTAIRLGDTIGNPLITGDPSWTPLAVTAADPSYPGAHSTISAAGAVILGALFPRDSGIVVTSDAALGMTRTFASYAAIAREAGLSRIYSGQHTPLDDQAGQALGRSVGWVVLQASLSRDFGNGRTPSVAVPAGSGY